MASSPRLHKNEIVNLAGDPMDKDDYICVDHEDVFRLKKNQYDRNMSSPRGWSQKRGFRRTVEDAQCAFCSCKNAQKWRHADLLRTPLKNLVINDLSVNGKKTTQRGSGITEQDIL